MNPLNVTCTVAQLSKNDLPLMRQLNALFAAAFTDEHSYARKPPSDAYLCKLLSQDHVIAVVALTGNQVTGGLVAYELPKLEQERSEFYIYDLAVAEEQRRQGIATTLIDHLRKLAAARGAWVIYVQADYGDDPAIALYEKLGSREEVLHFDIAVRRSLEQ